MTHLCANMAGEAYALALGAGAGLVDEVPYEEGMSVLDALRWIRFTVDSSLAIRYGCIKANACKTCMALVDGEVEYTCTARLGHGTVTVEPLPKRPLIRDLVTDILPEEEKATAVDRPFGSQRSETKETEQE